MASTTLYRIDGVKLANGQQAYGSKEMAVWYPTFKQFMAKKHGIKITTIKVADLKPTAASSSTHLGGYATDERTWDRTWKQIHTTIFEATDHGRVDHYRDKSQGFDPHTHGMLDVGYTTPCSYQIAATKRGRDGLARNGADRDKAHRPPQPWPTWLVGLTKMKTFLTPVTPIPRHWTPKPWMQIPVDGIQSGLFWSRVQWQLNLRPTGKLDHYTIRALKVWLGNPDDGRGILSPLNVQQLQYRVGVARDGQWGPATTRAFQRYLNNNR